MITAPAISFDKIDYHANENGFLSSPHTHAHYELFFFEKGAATHYIDFTAYQIIDNSCFLVSYNQIHYIEASPFSYNLGYVLSFNQAYFDLLEKEFRNLFGAFSKNPAYQLLPDLTLTLVNAFNHINIELKNKRLKSPGLVLNFVNIILTYVYRSDLHDKLGGSSSLRHKLADDFLNLVELQFKEHHTVQEYADLLFASAKQLNRICKKEFGLSALQLIHQRINLEAKRFLFHTNHPIKEIAYEVGFQDHAHFSNFFRKLNQESPENFRKTMSQIYK